MRLKQYLQEKYLTGKLTRSYAGEVYIEFFVNPSKKEMNDVAGEGRGGSESIRFIADNKSKKIYVWNPILLHDNAWKIIGDSRAYIVSTLLAGIAEKRGTNWVMTSATSTLSAGENWEWVNKYIKVDDFLKKYKGKDLGI